MEREADTCFVGLCQLGKQAVVIPFSSAEPVALAVECHTGHGDKIDVGIVGIPCACGLFYAVGSRLQAVFTGVDTQFQFVAYHYRKQNPLGTFPFLHKCMGMHFIRQRVIQQHCMGFLEGRMTFKSR